MNALSWLSIAVLACCLSVLSIARWIRKLEGRIDELESQLHDIRQLIL